MFEKVTKITQSQSVELELRNLRDKLTQYAQIADDLHDRGLFGLLLMRRGAFPRLVSLARELDDLNQHLPKPEQLTLDYVKLRHTLPELVYEINRLLRLYLAPEASLVPASSPVNWDGRLGQQELDFLVQTVRKASPQQPEPSLFDQDPDFLDQPYRNQVYEIGQRCSHSIQELNLAHRSIADILLVLCRHIEQLGLLIPLSFEQERDVLLQCQEVWCKQNAEAMERWRGRVEYELTHDISIQATPAQWQEAFAGMKKEWADNVNKWLAMPTPSPVQTKSLRILQFLLHYEYPGNPYKLCSRDIVPAIIRLLVDDGIDINELFRQMERYNTLVRIIRHVSPRPDAEQRFRQEVLSIAGKAREYWDEDKAPIETFDLIWSDWLGDPRILTLMHSQSPANIGLDLNLKLILNLTGILLRKRLIVVGQTKLSKEMHPDGSRADSYLAKFDNIDTKETELTQPLLDFALKVINDRLSAK